MNMMINAGYGHPASCLGLCDLFTALYFGGLMKYSPLNPYWPDRDRLVISCGHISALMYTALSMAGYFRPDIWTDTRAPADCPATRTAASAKELKIPPVPWDRDSASEQVWLWR